MYKLLNFRFLFLFASLCFILQGCQDTFIEVDSVADGSNYYPAETGKYWVYKVDSTIVVRRGNLRNSTSYVKETLESSFINPNGDSAYVLTRSFSKNPEGPFFPTDRWVLEKNSDGVVRIEENLQFLKMVFPIRVGDTWDGNRFDPRIRVLIGQEEIEQYKEWSYEVIRNKLSRTVNGIEYPNVLEIEQANDVNDIENRYSKEYYAPDVGLIKREMSILDTQCTTACLGLSWIEKAEKGFELTQVLIEHN